MVPPLGDRQVILLVKDGSQVAPLISQSKRPTPPISGHVGGSQPTWLNWGYSSFHALKCVGFSLWFFFCSCKQKEHRWFYRESSGHAFSFFQGAIKQTEGNSGPLFNNYVSKMLAEIKFKRCWSLLN